jgi:putative transferase (TIGR04331 family)
VLGNLLTNKKWLISRGLSFGKGKINQILSSAFNDKISAKSEQTCFTEYLRCLLVQTAPESYLDIYDACTFDGMPNINLSCILTSTAHWQDDDLKRFVSIDQPNTKLIIYQHGGTYGTMSPPIHQEKLELAISELYLTWGWHNNSYRNVIPFAVNIFSRRRWSTKPRRIRRIRIILTRFKPFSRGDLWDSNPWNKHYLDNIVKIAKIFVEKFQLEVVIRQHPAQCQTLDLKPYLENQLPNVTFESKNISKVYDGSIDIITQNSTVLLTTMIRGAPFLYFNPFGFFNLNGTARNCFELLHSANIFHDTIIGLEQHIAYLENHSFLIKWWSSDAVKLSVKQFLSIYGSGNLSQMYDAFKNLESSLDRNLE